MSFACNYIFYLTDSTDNFFAGSVFFEVIPNYDSLQPVIEFVKEDIKENLKIKVIESSQNLKK